MKFIPLLFALNVVVRAQQPLPGAQQASLTDDIKALIASTDWKGASIGVSVVSMSTGQELVSIDAKRAFIPASVQKLFTTSVALDKLGPEFRFITQLYLDGRLIGNGEFEGNIILRGGGDPTWSSLYGSTYEVPCSRFVDVLDSLGIQSIRGSIIGDDDVFDDIEYGPGWSWDDLQYDYAASIGGLNINGNSVNITVAPPPTIYDEAQVLVEPRSDYVRVVNAMRTVDSSGVTDVQTFRDLRSNVIDISGTVVIAPFGDTVHTSVSVENPTLFSVSLFKDALAKRGIRFKGAIIDVDDLNIAVNYDTLKPIAVYESAPLGEIIKVVNHESDNFGADVLFKMVSFQQSQEGSFVLGAQTVKQWCTIHGISSTELNVVDGSGLSRLNMCSPRQLTTLLSAMNDHPYSRTFKNSLAAPTESGTMKSRLTGTRAQGAVRAKTGSMNGVSTLAGYVVSRDGENYAFAIMMNGLTQPLTMARNLQDLICMRLTSLR